MEYFKGSSDSGDVGSANIYNGRRNAALKMVHRSYLGVSVRRTVADVMRLKHFI